MVRRIASLALFAAVLFCCTPTWAALVEIVFSAVVNSVDVHPPGETWGGRAVEVGAEVVGGYSFEVNPNDPEQAINPRFWFVVDTLSRDNQNLFINIQPFGTINHPSGDLYQAISQIIFAPQQPETSYDEIFGIDLQATAGGALAGTALDQVPDIALFDSRAEFFFDFRNRYGHVSIRADLLTLHLITADIPEPPSFALLGAALALLLAGSRTSYR